MVETPDEHTKRTNKAPIAIAAVLAVAICGAGAFYYLKLQPTPEDEALKNQIKSDPVSLKLNGLPPHAETILSHAGRLRSLDLSSSHDLTDSDLSALQNLPLEELNLSNTAVRGPGLRAVAKMPNLRELNLSHTKVTSDDLKELESAAKLEALDLTKTPTDRRFFKSMQAMMHLRTLAIAEDPDLLHSAHSLDFDASKLTSLDLSGDMVTDADLIMLSKVSRFKRLLLNSNPAMTIDGIKALTKIRDLKELHLRDNNLGNDLYKFAFDTGYKYTLVPTPGSMLTQMIAAGQTEVDLRESAVTDKDLAQIEHAPKIRLLSLFGCTLITDQGVSHLKNLKLLDELNLDLTHITNKSMDYLSTMDAMQSLSLMNIETLTSISGLKALPNLYSLNVSLNKLDDASAETVVKMPKLQRLIAISANQSFARSVIPQLAKTRIVEVHLAGCNLDDSDMEKLASDTKLQTLNVSQNRITGKGLFALAKISTLTNLKIEGNMMIKGADIQEFREMTKNKCVLDK